MVRNTETFLTGGKIAFAYIAIAFLLVVIGLSVAFYIDHLNYDSLIESTSEVEMGDSKAQVIEKLGQPIANWPKGIGLADGFDTIIEVPRDTLVYGKRLTLEEAYAFKPSSFWPVRSPYWPRRDDVMIEFDDEGTVINIKMPK